MKKRIGSYILSGIATAFILASCCNNQEKTVSVDGYSDKEAIANIFERKSVRSFTAQPVEQEKIELMVKAGMAAPSAMDRRPWEIVVFDNREAMDSLAEKLPYAQMLKEAPMAIVVCGNEEASGIWYIDCSAVTQNILLAAEALDLGAVWTGVYPSEDRVELVKSALSLPDNVIPLALVPVGYPSGENSPKDKYDENKVRYNKW
ncbi:MAG: nitroreductase family protein [Rikenellaceae bacterium]|nr:nitroreductase family protein [Rikenellaceae bacterium]